MKKDFNGLEDKFYVRTDLSSIVWVYFNPDASCGAQFVENTIGIHEFRETIKNAMMLPMLSCIADHIINHPSMEVYCIDCTDEEAYNDVAERWENNDFDLICENGADNKDFIDLLCIAYGKMGAKNNDWREV